MSLCRGLQGPTAASNPHLLTSTPPRVLTDPTSRFLFQISQNFTYERSRGDTPEGPRQLATSGDEEGRLRGASAPPRMELGRGICRGPADSQRSQGGEEARHAPMCHRHRGGSWGEGATAAPPVARGGEEARRQCTTEDEEGARACESPRCHRWLEEADWPRKGAEGGEEKDESRAGDLEEKGSGVGSRRRPHRGEELRD